MDCADSQHPHHNRCLTASTTVSRRHHDPTQCERYYPRQHRKTSCPSPQQDCGLTDKNDHDSWMRFLQSQYNPRHPHDPLAPTESTLEMMPCYESSAISTLSSSLTLTYSDQDLFHNPQLSRTPWTSWTHGPTTFGQCHESAEIEVNCHTQISSPRDSERSFSISSASSSWSGSCSSWSLHSSSEIEFETECDQAAYAVARRNKSLPPPILAPSCSHHPVAASRLPTPRSASPSQISTHSWTDDGYCTGSGGSDSEDDPVLKAWAKFETTDIGYQQSCLSASIWGPGWHQVDPLPPSFVKTMEQSELEAQEKALALAQEKAEQAAADPKAKAKRAKKQARAKAKAIAAAHATALDHSGVEDASPGSARLPRSLQFVD
ncbi:hypothetical protein B0O80DRAFT_426049 [Mortierella sp. GBAus27b]|nr:hypothetical protein B0O80DRAFT_426049 [Mortierella sp. GBAus27b]